MGDIDSRWADGSRPHDHEIEYRVSLSFESVRTNQPGVLRSNQSASG